jgi:hypothetical protein
VREYGVSARSRLKATLRYLLERALARMAVPPPGTTIPAGHFYSPIVEPTDPQVRKVCAEFATSEIGGGEDLKIDEDLVLQTLLRISEHYGKVAFPETKQDGFRYYYENPMYSYGDAIVLSCMLLDLRPRRLIEVGSGFSSCAAMDTCDRFLNGSVEFSFIEPHPDSLLSLLDARDPYRKRVHRTQLQDAPLEMFAELKANDILFIDSSHVVKIGSDVNYCFFRVLPVLKPGVVIHFHDIFYPFEYPPTWITDERLSWSEAYLLHAFLQYNDRYRIIYFNHFAERRFCAVLEERMPLCLRNSGGGIWLRKL